MHFYIFSFYKWLSAYWWIFRRSLNVGGLYPWCWWPVSVISIKRGPKILHPFMPPTPDRPCLLMQRLHWMNIYLVCWPTPVILSNNVSVQIDTISLTLYHVIFAILLPFDQRCHKFIKLQPSVMVFDEKLQRARYFVRLHMKICRDNLTQAFSFLACLGKQWLYIISWICFI